MEGKTDKEIFCRECGYEIIKRKYSKNFIEFITCKPTGVYFDGVKHEYGRYAHIECADKAALEEFEL